jgi:hypothetical protein
MQEWSEDGGVCGGDTDVAVQVDLMEASIGKECVLFDCCSLLPPLWYSRNVWRFRVRIVVDFGAVGLAGGRRFPLADVFAVLRIVWKVLVIHLSFLFRPSADATSCG